MTTRHTHRFGSLLIMLALVAVAPGAIACTACFGQQTDSPMASGMNWGIVSLLVVILGVLAAIATGFFLLIRRSGSPLAFGEPGGPEAVAPQTHGHA